MENWEIWRPTVPKTLEPMAAKFGVGNGIGDTYSSATFHYDPIRDFCSPPPPRTPARRRVDSDSASFFGGGYTCREARCTDFRDLYVKWRRIAQECAFGGPKTKFHISTPFPPRTQIFGVQKVLTMAMLTCKPPLIVIVAPWKFYSE